MKKLPEAQREDFQKRIDDMVSHARDKELQSKLTELAVQIGKVSVGTAGGLLLGPIGGLATEAATKYYATEFENAQKKESGVIKPAEKVAGRRRASKNKKQEKPKSPAAEALKTAVQSGIIGELTQSVWKGIKSLWGG